MDDNQVRKIIEVNNILAEWDPIGIGLHDIRYPHSEYIQYINSIFQVYESKESLFEYLIELKLSLAGGLDESIREEIGEIAKNIEMILAS